MHHPELFEGIPVDSVVIRRIRDVLHDAVLEGRDPGIDRLVLRFPGHRDEILLLAREFGFGIVTPVPDDACAAAVAEAVAPEACSSDPGPEATEAAIEDAPPRGIAAGAAPPADPPAAEPASAVEAPVAAAAPAPPEVPAALPVAPPADVTPRPSPRRGALVPRGPLGRVAAVVFLAGVIVAVVELGRSALSAPDAGGDRGDRWETVLLEADSQLRQGRVEAARCLYRRALNEGGTAAAAWRGLYACDLAEGSAELRSGLSRRAIEEDADLRQLKERAADADGRAGELARQLDSLGLALTTERARAARERDDLLVRIEALAASRRDAAAGLDARTREVEALRREIEGLAASLSAESQRSARTVEEAREEGRALEAEARRRLEAETERLASVIAGLEERLARALAEIDRLTRPKAPAPESRPGPIVLQ